MRIVPFDIYYFFDLSLFCLIFFKKIVLSCSSLVMESSPQSPSSSCAYLSVSSNEQAPQSPMSADSLAWERVDGVTEPLPDFETAVVMSEGS